MKPTCRQVKQITHLQCGSQVTTLEAAWNRHLSTFASARVAEAVGQWTLVGRATFAIDIRFHRLCQQLIQLRLFVITVRDSIPLTPPSTPSSSNGRWCTVRPNTRHVAYEAIRVQLGISLHHSNLASEKKTTKTTWNLQPESCMSALPEVCNYNQTTTTTVTTVLLGTVQ